MSMGKVAIADATGAVATNIGLVGEVQNSRRGRRVDQDGRSGEAQQLGEQQEAPQPSGEVVRLDHQRSRCGGGEERKESIRRVREHARVTGVASRVLQALERKRMGSARQVPLQFAWRLVCAQVVDRHDQFKPSGGEDGAQLACSKGELSLQQPRPGALFKKGML